MKETKIETVIIETIILDGKKTKVYLCDKKAKCRNSPNCGNLCKRTLNEKHAVKIFI